MEMTGNGIRKFFFLVTLAMMSMSGLVATDIFIPALGDMSHDLEMTSLQAQSLISIFLFGIAVMQLVYGPLSDSFGRRPFLLLGSGVFTLVSVLIALSDTVLEMSVLRFLQAVGACVGLTLGRAIVADLYDKEEAGKIFLAIFPFVGMSPAVAPVIGGVLNIHFGWPSCFLFIALFSALLFLLVLCFFRESKPKGKRPPLRFPIILGNYKKLLRAPTFIAYMLPVCFAYAAYFAYISESPFLLKKQGLTPASIGYSYISLSLLYVLGNLYARKTAEKRGLDHTLLMGYLFFLAGGSFLFLALATFPNVFGLSILGVSLIAFGNGHLLPLGTAGGVTAIPTLSGAASGVLGCLQLASGAAAAQLIGLLSNHEPFKVGLVIFLICLSGFLLHNRLFFMLSKKNARENLTGE